MKAEEIPKLVRFSLHASSPTVHNEPQTLLGRGPRTPVLSQAPLDTFHRTMSDRGQPEAFTWEAGKGREHHGQRKWMKNKNEWLWETSLPHVLRLPLEILISQLSSALIFKHGGQKGIDLIYGLKQFLWLL